MRLTSNGSAHPWLRRAIGALAALAVLAGLVHGLSQVRVETGVEEFVPADDPVLRATSEVARDFGGDAVVVLLESGRPGELLEKEHLPALLRLEGELAGADDVRTVYGPATILNQIAGQTQDLLAELIGYRDGLRGRAQASLREAGGTPAEVAAAGRTATRTFDERYSALLARGMPGGLPTLHNQTFVDGVVFNDEGDPRPQWDFVVPRDNAVAILVRPEASLGQTEVEALVRAVERIVERSDIAATRVTISGLPSVVAALGQQIRHEVPLLGVAALLGVGAWFLLTSWTRRRLRLLPLAATLLGTATTLALAGWLDRPLALTAVAFLPVLLGIGTDFLTYLHRGLGTRTVVAAAGASAAGFAALGVAPVPAVADLGLSLAVGLLITLGISLLVQRWLPAPGDATNENAASTPNARPRTQHVARRARLLIVGSLGLGALAGWALLPALTLQADFQTLASELPVYDDVQRVQRIIGSSGEVMVAVRGDDVVAPENLSWMRRTTSEIAVRHGDQLRPIVSAPDLLDFLGDKPTGSQLDAALRLLPRYLLDSVVGSSGDVAVLSYGVDVDDVDQLQQLRDDLEALIAEEPTEMTTELGGLPIVAVSAYEALGEHQALTAALGIGAAGTVLLVLLPRRQVAVLAVGSAILTSGLVLLGMWIWGVRLTPLTAGVGSLTAAVACEFTVVLAAALRSEDRLIARAVDLAAAASATGYAVLALSDLALIRNFGLLLATTVGVALIASRLVVWAFLGPVRDRPPVEQAIVQAGARTLVEVGA